MLVIISEGKIFGDKESKVSKLFTSLKFSENYSTARFSSPHLSLLLWTTTEGVVRQLEYSLLVSLMAGDDSCGLIHCLRNMCCTSTVNSVLQSERSNKEREVTQLGFWNPNLGSSLNAATKRLRTERKRDKTSWSNMSRITKFPTQHNVPHDDTSHVTICPTMQTSLFLNVKFLNIFWNLLV